MKQLLFPWAAFRYLKKIIEIREWVRNEKSAIIHCAMARSYYRKTYSKLKIADYVNFEPKYLGPQIFTFFCGSEDGI